MYVIRVITETDDGCFLVEYYKDMTGDDVILTDDLAEAALFDNEEACDNIFDHLCIVLGYMQRVIEKKKMFYVNPKLKKENKERGFDEIKKYC
jgi:hypothetical protein